MCKREASPPPLLLYKRRLVRGDAVQDALLLPQKESQLPSLTLWPTNYPISSIIFHHLALCFFFFFWLRLKDLTHLERRKSPQSISTLSIINKGLGRGRGRVAHCYWLKHFGKVIFKVWAFPFPLQAHLGPLGRNSWALLYFILGPLTLLRSNREGGEGGGGMWVAEEKMKTGEGKDKSLRDFKVEQRPIQMWIIARSAR